MFSAFKRLTSKPDGNNASGPPGHHAMSQNLQRKFAKGIQYNMKIVIKGDRNVGKTCLFHRLQGKKFVEEYVCTEEIQVASIQWNYKATDDVVKVEVWDIVDKGKKRVHLEGLKLGDSDVNTPALDAEFLDVYKGTNGVIMVMDITKNWSFDYVQRELAKVPSHIPVLVLGNHCDMAHHRSITADMVIAYIDSVQRPPGSAQIRYAEASMRNGFGLKLLHKFFCLPFLQLQRQTLLGQIERNRDETQATLEELDLFQLSEHADYDKFIDSLTNTRRQEAETNARLSTSQSSVQVGGMGGAEAAVQRSQSVPEVRLAAPPAQPFPNTPATARILARAEERDKPNNTVSGSKIHSVEEFMPDGGELDRSFLEDSPVHSKIQARIEHQDSDSEVETGNPLVAGFQDELDPDDVTLPHLALPPSPSPLSITPIPTSEQPSHKDNDVGITGLDDWLGSMAGGRVSPEGGEDSSPGADAMLRPLSDKTDKKKSKHKKKSSGKEKEKENLNKDEKKSKKKKTSRKNSVSNGPQGHDELEEFLNSHDSAYEAF